MIKLTIFGLLTYLAWPSVYSSFIRYRAKWLMYYSKEIKPKPWYKTYLIAKKQMHLEKQALALFFVFSLWVIHAFVIFGKMEPMGLIPRTLQGLVGILTSCLFHAGLNHLLSNSLGLLLFLPIFIFVRRNNIVTCLFLMIFFKGVMGWFLARSGVTIGASGLIYSIWGYLILNGILSKDMSKLVLSISLAVPTSFMFKGMSPLHVGPMTSFEGHFFGMVSGCLVAWICFDRAKHDWIELEAEVPLTKI